MTYATPSQINELRLAAERHGMTVGDAIFNYFGAPQSVGFIPASEIANMIACVGDVPQATMPDVVAINAAATAEAAERAARRDAGYVSPEDFYAAQDAKAAADARIDAIIEERGLGALTGKDRREARRLIRRELEA